MLGLSDTAGAVAALPSIGTSDARQATGITDAKPEIEPPRIPQQLQGQSGLLVAQRGTSGSQHEGGYGASNTEENGFVGPESEERVTGVEPATFSLGS